MEDPRKIVKIRCVQGKDEEVVDLLHSVKIKGNVEEWLGYLETEMKYTMKDHCRRAAVDSNSDDLRKFVDSTCGQFALLGIQLQWTSLVTEALMRCKQDKMAMIWMLIGSKRVYCHSYRIGAWRISDQR